jgi:hypothetical protein
LKRIGSNVEPKPEVIIRTFDRDYAIRNPEKLDEVAARLQKILNRRKQWIEVGTLRQEIAIKCLKILKTMLGFQDSDFEGCENLLRDGILEVSIDASSAVRENAQRFPWEFLLSSAAEVGGGLPLIVRHLNDTQKRTRNGTAREIPKKFNDLSLLVVRSLPGFLDRYYSSESLEAEQENVEANLGVRSRPALRSNPTLRELRLAVSRNSPRVIHLAGVDTLQAEQIRNPNKQPPAIQPGMMLRAEDGDPQAVSA